MEKLANHTTLKEWGSVIEALARGEQVILIRKGGIADTRFGLEASRFYLYPTYFHQPSAPSSQQEVSISHWCEVVRSWRVSALEVLLRLEPFVVMSRAVLETRYRFRADQAIHVIGVRVFALPEPRAIEVRPEYEGCRSWLSVEDEIDVAGSIPVLEEPALEARLLAVDRAIRIAASVID
jgi:hypothetical protein